MVVGHLPPALAREHEQRRYATVDVDLAVCAGRARLRGQRIQCLFVLHQVLGECFEHLGALVEGVAPQVHAPDVARVPEHRGEIDALARDAGDGFAAHRARQHRAVPVALDPAVLYEVAELHADTPGIG